MNTIMARNKLQISTRILYDEFAKRNIPIDILAVGSSLLEYTALSGTQHYLFSTCSDKSSATGVIIANNKSRTALVANQLGIPIPEQITSRNIRDAHKLLSIYKKIVIKPVDGSCGEGVTTNITSTESLKIAYAYAKKYNHTIVAQQHLEGSDVRLLIIDGSFCSAVIRRPAHVTGDGVSSIKELIDLANADGLRGNTEVSSLMAISQSAARHFIGDAVSVIPSYGEEVRVVGPANVSLGGSLHEATNLVSPAMITDAEAITKKLGLGICGVDMIWDQTTGEYCLIEVNATPGIDIHDDPFSGTSSNCVPRYVDWLLS